MSKHDNRIALGNMLVTFTLTSLKEEWKTYAIMPPTAIRTPRIDLSPTDLPDVIHPKATMRHVFKWPTTVLDTGPV